MDTQASGRSDHYEFGNITDFNFVAEVIPRVSTNVWLVPRLQFGLTAYNASGTSKDGETRLQSECGSATSTTTAIGNCSGIESPHLGYNMGAGFGVLFATGSPVRIRIDGLLDYYSFGRGEYTFALDTGSLNGVETAHLKHSMTGTRYLLLAGIEI